MPRRYPFTTLKNARDLGGYATADGRVTRWGVFLRSACTDRVSAEEIQALLDLGLTDVIDLRGIAEAAARPSALRDVPGLRCANIPLSPPNDTMGVSQSESLAGAAYLEMAEYLPSIREVLQILARAEGLCLFHCTAGKDRTGVTTAILLLLAGADPEDIVADYMVSEWYFRRELEEILTKRPDIPPHFMRSGQNTRTWPATSRPSAWRTQTSVN